MNASTYCASGSGLHEANFSNWVLSRDANKSISGVPKCLTTVQNITGSNFHSVSSWNCLDSWSASTFKIPGICAAVNQIFLCLHQSHIDLVISLHFHFGDFTPHQKIYCPMSMWMSESMSINLSINVILSFRLVLSLCIHDLNPEQLFLNYSEITSIRKHCYFNNKLKTQLEKDEDLLQSTMLCTKSLSWWSHFF